jgi:hypothetical protein
VAGLYRAIRDVPATAIPGPTEPAKPFLFEGVNTYFWETVARFGTHIMAFRVDGSTQKIVLDATAPNGSISIKLSDCNAKQLAIREINVCVNGDPSYKMMVLGSAPYR